MAGLAGAAGLYWFQTSYRGPSMEEMMPGYSAANQRQTSILYGHAGKMMWQWHETFAHPETQAGLVLLFAVVIAAGCFRVAWLDAHNER